MPAGLVDIATLNHSISFLGYITRSVAIGDASIECRRRWDISGAKTSRETMDG